jgi:hypothetical protein
MAFQTPKWTHRETVGQGDQGVAWVRPGRISRGNTATIAAATASTAPLPGEPQREGADDPHHTDRRQPQEPAESGELPIHVATSQRFSASANPVDRQESPAVARAVWVRRRSGVFTLRRQRRQEARAAPCAERRYSAFESPCRRRRLSTCSTSVLPLIASRAVSSRPTQNCTRLRDMTSTVCARRYWHWGQFSLLASSHSATAINRLTVDTESPRLEAIAVMVIPPSR